MNPIPWQQVIDSRWNKEGKLLIQIMDVDTGYPFFCSHFTNVDALQDAVAASCAMPYVASIRPFKMKRRSFSHMQIRNHCGQRFVKRTTKCFDGETSDIHFRAATSWLDSKSVCVLTTAKSDHSNKCYPFGRRLWWLEFLLGWPSMAPYFIAIYRYQQENIFGGALKQFENLKEQSQNNPNQTQLVTLPNDLDFTYHHVFDPDIMKQHIQTGRDLVKPWLSHI